MNEMVAKWNPPSEEGNNYWTDNEGRFAAYKKNIPSVHFSFDPKKSNLLPIPADQLILNPNLKQNPVKSGREFYNTLSSINITSIFKNM